MAGAESELDLLWGSHTHGDSIPRTEISAELGPLGPGSRPGLGLQDGTLRTRPPAVSSGWIFRSGREFSEFFTPFDRRAQ